MDRDIEGVIDAARNAASVKDLWNIVAGYFRQNGVVRISYHLYPAPTSTDIDDVTVVARGFPEDWACQYIEEQLHKVDPIPMLARTAHTPFFWDDISKLIKTTAAQDVFLEKLHAAGVRNGIAFQVYGPALRNGYVGLGFETTAPRPPPAQVFEFQCIAQMGHLRYCALTEDDSQLQLDLSPREREVLQWMAHGKSNSVIADIMGVSRHTVDTLARRTFEKIGVNDRTTAVLRGVGSGLILG